MTGLGPGSRALLIVASILGASGVLLGAFGAHGLSSLVETRWVDVWETAVRYQLIHALALLVLFAFPAFRGQSGSAVVGAATVAWLWIAGVVLFSGSLYALVVAHAGGIDARWLGPLTPLGGVALVAGWLWLIRVGRAYRQNVGDGP